MPQQIGMSERVGRDLAAMVLCMLADGGLPADGGVARVRQHLTMPQQIGMCERVGRDLAAMVMCMLADSGLQTIRWGLLMFTPAFLGNRAPHSAVSMQSPYKFYM